MNDKMRLDYSALLSQRPADFDGPPDGVRIAVEPEEIASIEVEVGQRYAEKGWPREWAQVGLCYRDPYLRLLRDAVVFPGGYRAIHHRVLSNSHPSGAAVLPVHGERIVLIRHFRHPSRKWHWEIPRGGIEPGQTAEQAARAELREEIDAVAEALIPLGEVHGSTALISGAVALYLARISRPGRSPIHEGIAGCLEVTIGELERMISDGEITDSFTLAAVFKARLALLL